MGMHSSRPALVASMPADQASPGRMSPSTGSGHPRSLLRGPVGPHPVRYPSHARMPVNSEVADGNQFAQESGMEKNAGISSSPKERLMTV